MRTRALKKILLVALVLRLMLVAAAWKAPGRFWTNDSGSYVCLSDSLAEGKFDRDGQPEIFRTPGYPAWLLLGVPFGSYWARMLMIFQVLLDVGTVYLTFLLGSMLAGDRAGVWAAGLQAISPLAISAGTRLLTEGPFTFLLILSILLLVHAMRSRAWWSLLSAGVVMAAACYVRPVGQVFAFLAVVVVLIGARRLWRALALGGVVAVCLAPWVVRNGLCADYWGFSSFATDSQYSHSASAVLAEGTDMTWEQMHVQMGRELETELRQLPPGENTPGEIARRRAVIARQSIIDHPWIFLKLHMKGDVAFFLPAASDVLEVAGLTTGNRGTLDVLHEEGLWAATKHYFGGNIAAMVLGGLMTLLLLVRYFGVVVCGIRKARLRMPPEVWLCVLFIAAAALLPGPGNHPRYRAPVAPLLSIAAAVGWISLLPKRRWERKAAE